MKYFLRITTFLLLGLGSVFADDNADAEKRRDTIRYGTDNEIATLIGTLRTEKTGDFDQDLVELADSTSNNAILTGLLSFFAEREQGGLEQRALAILDDYEDNRNDIVLGAIDYLGKVKSGGAAQALIPVLDADSGPLTNTAIRAYGRIASVDGGDEAADYLIAYYRDREPANETQREIVSALGETGSRNTTEFLVGLIGNQEERYVLRMAALEAVGKIGDENAKEAVINAVLADDPNVRSSAIGALGSFDGDDVEKAILDAFRDSFFRTRLGACEAAGKRKLATAIPYLRYRALNDEAVTVRDEAIRALGAVGSSEAAGVLEEIFEGERNADRIRSLAAEMLVKQNPDAYTAKVTAAMEDAKKKNRAALAAGFERALAAKQ
ncbi:MAG: HEAT repeat domain-containing protein [Spirochaetaceae bacterium]|jgi:HEAT repeat protein|nr:HEAT repeat domain-containing protein [Spirochaetaceae bacterium]